MINKADFRKAFDDGKIDEFSLMAGLVYGEARKKEDNDLDERKEYMAIASTVLNRVQHKGRFPDTIVDVILQPWQFSCFNNNDPNIDRIWKFLTSPGHENDVLYKKIMGMIEPVLKENTVDFSNGADHYVAIWFYDQSHPDHWCRKYRITAMHGGHIFLKE